MYTPSYYRNENIEEVREFIVHNGFGILVSCSSKVALRQAQDDFAPPSPLGKGAGGLGPIATHIPMLLDKNEKGRDILSGHVSRANPHHKTFIDDSQVLAIFLGPRPPAD